MGGTRGSTRRPVPGAKTAYEHASSSLAASSAVAADRPGAAEPPRGGARGAAGALRDPGRARRRAWWPRSGTGLEVLEDYRGLNATMHTVEALLAAADVLGDHVPAPSRPGSWTTSWAGSPRPTTGAARALRPAGRPLLDYHRDRPADPFRPYGATIGHGFEWARPWPATATPRNGAAAPRWWVEHAVALADAAAARRVGARRRTTGSSTPSAGTRTRSSGSGCTGWRPRRWRPPRRCTRPPATLGTPPATAPGGRTPARGSSIPSAGPGSTSGARRRREQRDLVGPAGRLPRAAGRAAAPAAASPSLATALRDGLLPAGPTRALGSGPCATESRSCPSCPGRRPPAVACGRGDGLRPRLDLRPRGVGGPAESDWYAAVPTLTAAATVTTAVGLGTLVASPNFRHPVPPPRGPGPRRHLGGALPARGRHRRRPRLAGPRR